MSATAEPVAPQFVGNAFVQQYYHILHQSPSLVHRFYQDASRLGRPDEDGAMSITTTMKDINEKIISLKYDDFRAEIKSIDAQESFNGGVSVLVTGQMARKDNVIRNFTQTFFLAPQEKGYFVLNDMFRYIEDASLLTSDLVQINKHNTTPTPEQDPSPVLDIDQEVDVPVVVTVEKSVDDIVVNVEKSVDDIVVNVEKSVDDIVVNVEPMVVEEISHAVIKEEVPPVVVVEEVPPVVVVEEVPIPEVGKVVPVETPVVTSESKIEGFEKKSYASIVMVPKQSVKTLSSPAPRRTVPKVQEQANPVKPVLSAAEIPISGSEATEDGNNQEGEADGYSIYIKGLPMTATPSILEEEFKKFGIIKSGGIQVRSNKGFCFGFVEFEAADSVVKALEASPVVIGGRHAVVEEKRSTNSRGYNRGVRIQGGRVGPGFRNDGMRGGGRVGNYGVNNNNVGGRGSGGDGGGYHHRDFGNNNRFGNRGGFQNRGGDGGGYHHHNNQRGILTENGGGGRMNQRPNGGAKETSAIPRVSVCICLRKW